MNKLGFAINYASDGLTTAKVCNKGQWTNKVVDIREFLKLLSGLAIVEHGIQTSTGKFVTFISFDDNGCFLTQMKAINGRFGDFLAGWIYIPNTIDATGEEVINTYNYVRNILSQSNLSDLKDDIESFFSKEYPSKEVAAPYVASKGQLYGVRFLGHYTLKEIVGEHRYQPYYSDYKVVFLLNNEEEVAITKEAASSFRDLTNKDIVKTSILVPPTNASLQALGEGTKIHAADGSDFNQPLLVNVGSNVPLVLSRIGFENIKIAVNVTQERQIVDFSNVKIKIKWMKKISALMFTVRNRKHDKIEKGVRISVNGTDITYQEDLVSEEDCQHALIKVSAHDYKTFEERRNLLTDDLCITLSRKVNSFQTTIELSNGSKGEMTIKSKDFSFDNDSPLKGYKFDEDYNGNKVLKLSSWFVWKQIFLGIFAALAAAMLIIACVALNAWIDTHHFKFGLPPWEEVRPTKTGLLDTNNDTDEAEETKTDTLQVNQQILDYLNKNNQWAKARLDQDSLTKGLYDMINYYHFSEIMNVNIENCDKIYEIKVISKKMIDNGFSLSGSYSQDGIITIKKWIETVNAKYKKQLAMDDDNNSQSDYNPLVDEIVKKKAAEEAAEAAKKKAPKKKAPKKKTVEDVKKNGGL